MRATNSFIFRLIRAQLVCKIAHHLPISVLITPSKSFILSSCERRRRSGKNLMNKFRDSIDSEGVVNGVTVYCSKYHVNYANSNVEHSLCVLLPATAAPLSTIYLFPLHHKHTHSYSDFNRRLDSLLGLKYR